MKNIIRRLGVGETWLALLHDKGHGTAQTTTLATIEGAIDKALFKQALNFLSHRYQQLCSRLCLTETGYFLVNDLEFEQIPINYLAYQNDNDWQDLMQREVNWILPQDHYLWRATLLSPAHHETQNHYIMITIHHAIYDGLSSVALIDSLLSYFNNPSVRMDTIPVPDPIEMLYAPALKNNENCKEVLKKLDKIKRYEWPHQSPTPIAKRETHLKFEFFPSEQVNQLRTIGKKHHVTVTSMLNAAMLLSAQKILGQSFNAGLSTPVSLLSLTNNKVNAENMAFLCGIVNTVHPDISDKTDFWQLASEYQQQLKNRLSVFEIPTADYNFDVLKKSMDFIWDPNRNYFCYDFLVSNLGLLHFSHESSAYRIKAMRYGTCRQAGDNNMMLLVSSTHAGMFCTFGYTYPLITDEWAEKFITNFKNYI